MLKFDKAYFNLSPNILTGADDFENQKDRTI